MASFEPIEIWVGSELRVHPGNYLLVFCFVRPRVAAQEIQAIWLDALDIIDTRVHPRLLALFHIAHT